MIQRKIERKARQILAHFPILGLVGPRQVGKTTLAKFLGASFENTIYLDLESPRDVEKLSHAETYFEQFADRLIIIDEIQIDKKLFPILRSAIDKNRKPSRFIILGSASPELIRSSSESLAGRIAYLEISGFNVLELEEEKVQNLWLQGGYPEPLLSPAIHQIWMKNYIQTYLQRDLPQLGLNINPIQGHRLWSMLAHFHGQTINYSELSKSLEMDMRNIKKHLDFLEQAFIIQQLKPYHSNTKKRLVKTPKLYFRDSGILHHLLAVDNQSYLMGHPKQGSSWEGFVIEQIYQLKNDNIELAFYRSHNGAEIDLVLLKAGQPRATIEIKFGDHVKLSRGNLESVQDLKTKENYVINASNDQWEMNNGTKVIGLYTFIKDVLGMM